MFLPFIKKNSTELELLSKIKKKYTELPLSSILGLIILYNRIGLDEINKKIEKFSENYNTIEKAVGFFIRENLTKDVDFEFDLNSIARFSRHIYVRDELLSKHTAEDIIYFAFIIQKNENDIFKTVVSDLIDTTKNLHVSVINTITSREKIFNNIPDYVKLTSENEDETIFFSSREYMEDQLVRLAIEDPLMKKSYRFIFEKEQLAKYVYDKYGADYVSIENPYGISDGVDKDGNIIDVKTSAATQRETD